MFTHVKWWWWWFTHVKWLLTWNENVYSRKWCFVYEMMFRSKHETSFHHFTKRNIISSSICIYILQICIYLYMLHIYVYNTSFHAKHHLTIVNRCTVWNFVKRCTVWNHNTADNVYRADCCGWLSAEGLYFISFHYISFHFIALHCIAMILFHFIAFHLISSIIFYLSLFPPKHTATQCNSLQHTATPCNILQHPATHSNTLQHTATLYNTLQHSATHCNTLQHTATLPHTDTHRDDLCLKKELISCQASSFTRRSFRPNTIWCWEDLLAIRVVKFGCVLQCVAVCCSVLQCVAVCCTGAGRIY